MENLDTIYATPITLPNADTDSLTPPTANATISLQNMPSLALRYLAFVATGLEPGKCLRNVQADSVRLQGWRQNRDFRQAEAKLYTSGTTLGPQIARALLASNSAIVASKVIDRALGDTSQAQRAAETVLEATGIIGPAAQGITISTQAQQLVQNITIALQQSALPK